MHSGHDYYMSILYNSVFISLWTVRSDAKWTWKYITLFIAHIHGPIPWFVTSLYKTLSISSIMCCNIQVNIPMTQSCNSWQAAPTTWYVGKLRWKTYTQKPTSKVAWRAKTWIWHKIALADTHGTHTCLHTHTHACKHTHTHTHTHELDNKNTKANILHHLALPVIHKCWAATFILRQWVFASVRMKMCSAVIVVPKGYLFPIWEHSFHCSTWRQITRMCGNSGCNSTYRHSTRNIYLDITEMQLKHRQWFFVSQQQSDNWENWASQHLTWRAQNCIQVFF